MPDALLSASDSSVFVVSLLSLSLSNSSGSTVLHQVSNFGFVLHVFVDEAYY